MEIQVLGGSVRLDTICEFISLAHHLNFTITAKELNVSQPSLSKHISDLEKALGVVLIQRGRKISLTAAGKYFSSHALMMLHDYNKLVEKCREIESENGAQLLMQSPLVLDTLSAKTLDFTREFFSQSDSRSFRMIPLTKSNLLDAIKDGSMNLGFYMAYGDIQATEQELLDQNIMVLAAHEEYFSMLARNDHPILQKESITFDDIRNLPIEITLSNAFDFLNVAIQAMFAISKATPQFEIQTSRTLMEFLMLQKQSDSVYLFPTSMLEDTTFSLREDLKSKPINDERCKVGLFVVADNPTKSETLSTFFKELSEHLKGNSQNNN